MAIVKEVLFNEGEGLVTDDLKNLQRFLRAQVNDGLLRPRMRRYELVHEPGSSSPGACYGYGHGGWIKTTGTNLRSSNTAGVIAQVGSGSVTGDDPQALLYYLAEDELQTDHAAAHATLDRIDIICVKLEHTDGDSETRDFKDAVTGLLSSSLLNKRRRVTLTKQVVQGTNAAAGTAAEPAVPAGFVKWAAVKIPATFASTFVANTHFRDWRIPCGSLGVQVLRAQHVEPSTDFPTYSDLRRTATAAGQVARVYLDSAPRSGRVVRLQICAQITGAGAIRLRRASGITGTASTMATIKSFGDTGGAELIFDAILGNTVSADTAMSGADALVGPVWGRGREVSPGIAHTTGFDEQLFLEFTSGANGDYFAWAHVETASP